MQTQITFVLDSSGSMSTIADDTVGGFNTFLEDQKDQEGTASVSLYNFDTYVERVYQAIPIEEAPPLDGETYTPGGNTALHDAISTAIQETEARHAEFEPEARPDNIVVVVLTDGKENASETPQERVREQVQHRRAEHDWEFMFIGANQDAALTASEMGMREDRSLDMAHTGEGAKSAYESTSERINNARQSGSIGEFQEQDRERQEEAASSTSDE